MKSEECFYCNEYYPKDELTSFTGFSVQAGEFEPILTCHECKSGQQHRRNVESTLYEREREAEMEAPYEEDEEDY